MRITASIAVAACVGLVGASAAEAAPKTSKLPCSSTKGRKTFLQSSSLRAFSKTFKVKSDPDAHTIRLYVCRPGSKQLHLILQYDNSDVDFDYPTKVQRGGSRYLLVTGYGEGGVSTSTDVTLVDLKTHDPVFNHGIHGDDGQILEAVVTAGGGVAVLEGFSFADSPDPRPGDYPIDVKLMDADGVRKVATGDRITGLAVEGSAVSWRTQTGETQQATLRGRARRKASARAAKARAASHETAEPNACSRLKGRDLMRGKAPFKLVDRASRNRTGRTVHRYLACGKPEHRIRAIRTVRPGDRLEVLDFQGRQLLARETRGGRVAVHDVLTGRSRGLRAGGRVLDAVVYDTGDVAAVVRSGSAPASIVGLDVRSGRAVVLDPGPGVLSLSLKRKPASSGITWDRAGRRSADLAALPVPCSALPKAKPLGRMPSVVVADDAYDAEYLQGELTGRETRTRACLKPDGVARLVGFGRYHTGGVQGGNSVSVEAAAGTSLLVSETFVASQGETFSSGRRLDLATGQVTDLYPRKGRSDLDAPLEGAVLATGGQVAAIFTVGDDEQVVAFTADGTPKALDKGPATEIDDQLALEGTVLSWTRAGQRKTADLAAL